MQSSEGYDNQIKLALSNIIGFMDDFENGVNGKARMLMFLGEPELAMDHLEMAMEIGDPYAVHLNRITVFDPLRDNPRFQALLKKMNLLPE